MLASGIGNTENRRRSTPAAAGIPTPRIHFDQNPFAIGRVDLELEHRQPGIGARLHHALDGGQQRKRLQQDGIETRLEICRDLNQMAQAVTDYGRLESSGWKASSGTAVDAANAQGRFYRAMLEAFAARGAASVYRYWPGGELVAMDLCVEGGGCIVVLKTAYDERLARQLSPALLMREEACRRLFDEDRFGHVEFDGRIMKSHLR